MQHKLEVVSCWEEGVRRKAGREGWRGGEGKVKEGGKGEERIKR